MGNRFEITVVDEDLPRATAHIEDAIEEIRRIERLLTTFSDDSVTNLINRHAGITLVPVDKEVFSLIQRSIRNQLQNMACVIIDDSNKIFTSNNINLQ